MTMIELFMRQPMAQAIGWALLQFVWQGAVLGVLTAMVLAFLRRSASDIRYVVSTIGLALMLTMPIVTAWQSLEGSRPRRAAATAETNGATAPAMPSAISARGPASPPAILEGITSRQPGALAEALSWDPGTVESFGPWMPLLVFTWMCGVLLLSLRLASGWLWVQAMKRHRAVAGGGHLAAHGSKAGAAAAHRSPRPAAGIGRRRRAHGDWLAAASRSPSGQRAGGAVAPAGRGDSGPRAGAHSPARLSRQPAADARRDAAVLSPGRLVALAANSSGARELLRRSCRQPLRRSLRVRQGAGGSRRAEGHYRPSGSCRNGRLAASARSPARRSAVACGARAWLGGRHRGAPADDRRGGRSDWQRAVPPRSTGRHPVEREPGGPLRSLRSAGCRAGRQRAS